MRKFFSRLSLAALFMIVGTVAWGQNACIPGQALTAKGGFNNLAAVVPGATVQVSPGPIFINSSSSTPISGNTLTADNYGNYLICATQGTTQAVTVSGNNMQTLSYQLTFPATAQGATLNANNTFTGTNTFLGSSTFTNPVVIQATLSCKTYNNIRCVDAANSAGWTGTDAFAWINAAIANLPTIVGQTGGGIVDARGLGPNTFSVSTVLAIPTEVTVLFDSTTVFNMNQAGGSTQDAITLADGSAMLCSPLQLPNLAGIGYGGFFTTAATNVRSLLSPANRTSPTAWTTSGCNFVGKSASAVVANAFLDMQGAESNATIANTNVWNCYNTICLQLQPQTNSGVASDMYLYNLQLNGGGVTGARPCVFRGSGASHTLSNVFGYGVVCQHAGSGFYELEVNGNNAASGSAAATAINFYGGHVEEVVGSLGVKLADVSGVNFYGTEFSGSTAGTYFTISESGANITQAINLNGLYGTGSGTNWVVNTAATGGTSAFSTNPFNYVFKVSQAVAGGNVHPLFAAEDGTCTMATATTCTFSITASFTNTPLSYVSIDAASAPPGTAIDAKCAVSGTTVTITAGTSNSLKWDCMLVGNAF